MGCHTWAYKKANILTDKEKSDIIEKEINSLNEKGSILVEPKKQYIKEMIEIYTEYGWAKKYTEDEYKKQYEKSYKYLNELKSGNFEAYLKKNKDSADIEYYKGEYYVNCGFDTPFRVYGYPENKFRNKNRLLGWLKRYSKSGNCIGYYNESDYKFITGFTDELIDRIEDYYKEHGEDNLLFTFG